MKYKLEILKEPAKTESKGSILFVHGICHAAWCWPNFMDYFSEAGYDCYSLSYRGHGASEGRDHLNRFRFADYVEDILEAVSLATSESGQKPFLVGHSMGGAVVQKYVGSHAETLRGAVLFASAPAGGLDPIAVLSNFLNPCRNKSFFIALGLNKKPTIDLLRKCAFFAGTKKGIAQEDLEFARKNLQVESRSALFLDMTRPYTKNYKVSIPMFVIGSADDAYFGTGDQKKNGQAYGVKPVILHGICHNMMMDRDWKRSAEPVLQFMLEH